MTIMKKKTKENAIMHLLSSFLSRLSINIARLQDKCGGSCGEQSTSATGNLSGAGGELSWG
jgi:hypothetical protein